MIGERILFPVVERGLFPAAALVFALLAFFSCGPKADPVMENERKMVSEGLEILRSGSPMQRDSTIRTLYGVKHSELLTAHLNDPDPNVRIGMVSALGYIKDKASAPSLNRLLVSTNDYLLRETVIYAIGEICDTSSVPILLEILNDPATERDLRLSIPITLASFGRTEAAPLIEKAFTDALDNCRDDIEYCSYVALGILEVLNPGNIDKFRGYLPSLREMAERRKSESGEEDGIYTNFYLTIQELENDTGPVG